MEYEKGRKENEEKSGKYFIGSGNDDIFTYRMRRGGKSSGGASDRKRTGCAGE